MKCSRCGSEFPVTIPVCNVENYVGSVLYCCPNCGKAYRFTGRVTVEVNDVNDACLGNLEYDDWHRKIVKDIDYEKDKL